MSEPPPPPPDDSDVAFTVTEQVDDIGRAASITTHTARSRPLDWEPDDGDPFLAVRRQADASVDEGEVPHLTPRPPWWRRLYHQPAFRAVIAGLLLAGSLPPWGWWPLAFVGIAIVDRLLAGTTWKQRLARGTAVGWALFTPTIVWISQLTAPGYVIAVLFFGFLLGLFCDLATGGPLGVSSIALMLAQLAVKSQRRHIVPQPFVVQWFFFAVFAILAEVVQLALNAIAASELIDARPALFQALSTIAAYPLFAWLFSQAQRSLLRTQ